MQLLAGDTVALPRAPVVLHRISSAAQGPLDSARADALGRFAFAFRPDTGGIYLLSVRYRGIEYFSQPLSGDEARPDTALLIIVADTSSAAPVRARERTLLISRPDESGTRAVIDWFVLENAGERTRVASASGASWGAELPPDAQNVGLADLRMSQFASDALEFRRDSVLLFAPLSPGERELVLQYRIPGTLNRVRVPVPPGLDSVFVLLEEPEGRVEAPPLRLSDTQRLEGRSFQRWAGPSGGASELVIVFAGPALSSGTLLLLLLAAVVAGFGVLVVRSLRRSEPVVDPGSLARAIAQLDLAREGRGTLPPEEEARYQAERGRLKAELARALGRRESGR